MAETATIDIDGMDDKAFDALKSDMMAGKDVTASADAPAEEEIVPEDDTSDTYEEPTAEAVPSDGSKPAEKQEMVPHGRFHHERELRKATEQKLTAAETRMAQLLETFNRLSQQPQPQAQQPEPTPEPVIPDKRVDPLGYLDYLESQVMPIKQQLEQRTQQETLQREEQQFMSQARQQFEQTVAEDPSVRTAYEHVWNMLEKEANVYRFPNEDAKAQYMRGLERDHMAYAQANRIPLGDYIKGLAAARGWTPQQMAAQAAPAAQAIPAAPDTSIADIRRASASLTPSGGAPAQNAAPTPQQLLDMTPKQFDAYMAKLEKEGGNLSKAFAA